jgi:hypothetical protein
MPDMHARQRLAQVERWPEWAAHIRAVDLAPPGSLTPQSAGASRLQGGSHSTFRVTEFEPPRHWLWTGPFLWVTVRYDHRFEPWARGARDCPGSWSRTEPQPTSTAPSPASKPGQCVLRTQPDTAGPKLAFPRCIPPASSPEISLEPFRIRVRHRHCQACMPGTGRAAPWWRGPLVGRAPCICIALLHVVRPDGCGRRWPR